MNHFLNSKIYTTCIWLAALSFLNVSRIPAQDTNEFTITPGLVEEIPSPIWVEIFRSHELVLENALQKIHEFLDSPREKTWQVMFAFYLSSDEKITEIRFYEFESIEGLDHRAYTSRSHDVVFCALTYNTSFNKHPKCKIDIFTNSTAKQNYIQLRPYDYFFQGAVFKIVIDKSDDVLKPDMEVFNLNQKGIAILSDQIISLNREIENLKEADRDSQQTIIYLRKAIKDSHQTIVHLNRMVTSQDSIMKKLKEEKQNLRRPGWKPAVICAALGLASGYFLYLADDAYDDYLALANNNRSYDKGGDKYDKHTLYHTLGISLGGVAIGGTFAFYVWPKPFKSKVFAPPDSLKQNSP